MRVPFSPTSRASCYFYAGKNRGFDLQFSLEVQLIIVCRLDDIATRYNFASAQCPSFQNVFSLLLMTDRCGRHGWLF
jgi:hypothetical protein